MKTVTMKKGQSPIIIRVGSADKNTKLTVEELWAKSAPKCHDHVQLKLFKAYEDPQSGATTFIDDISDKETEIEMEINGAIARNSRGTVAMFLGHICGPVTLPGKDIRISEMSDPNKKDDDKVGFSEATTFVQFIWDEGSQTGEIRRYINSAFDVRLGTMHAGFPIDNPEDDRTPVPAGCIKPVKEDDINA